MTFATSDERLQGDITGVHNEPDSAFESQGAAPDTDLASLRVMVSKKKLVSSGK
jgi:hypothetical protein